MLIVYHRPTDRSLWIFPNPEKDHAQGEGLKIERVKTEKEFKRTVKKAKGYYGPEKNQQKAKETIKSLNFYVFIRERRASKPSDRQEIGKLLGANIPIW